VSGQKNLVSVLSLFGQDFTEIKGRLKKHFLPLESEQSMYKASQSPFKDVRWLSTGFSALDKILGGGVPFRRILEVSGVYSVGKSTLALTIIARAQKEGFDCLYADAEFSFDEAYASKLGVNLDLLDLAQERFAESTLDAVEDWADKHKDAVIVIDSIGALLPRQEAEKSADGKTIGGQARLIATFCRKIVPILALNNNSLIVLNHQFTDVMSGRLKTSGGAKLEYARAIWLMLRAANKRIMSGESQVGLVIEAEIRKNKLAPTVKQKCELTMLFGEGFSAEADLLQELLDSGEVTKKGNTYFRGTEKLGVGLTKAREALKV
jgi:recombination protein RecA